MLIEQQHGVEITEIDSQNCRKTRNYLTAWKNEKFTVNQKKFRQINSLVFSLVKTLLSRNHFQKV